MAYNLDFSAWSDMRKAQSNAIRNKGNIEAQSIKNKYNTYSKAVSGLADVGSWLYDNWDSIKAENALEQALKQSGGIQGLSSDPMQILSSTNKLSDNPISNYKRAQIISGLLGYGI